MDTAEIIMYPIKQRIFRYFLIHETGSVDEIKKSIARVLSASLYRHIKISANSSVLEAAGENRIAVGYMKRKAAKVGKMRRQKLLTYRNKKFCYKTKPTKRRNTAVFQVLRQCIMQNFVS